MNSKLHNSFWTVTNTRFTGQYTSRSPAGFCSLFTSCHIGHLISQDITNRRQSLTWFVSLKSFHTLIEKTGPARKALLAFWRYPYVCDGGGSSGLLWAKALPLQYSKIYEQLIVLSPLMSWQIGNSNFILLPVHRVLFIKKKKERDLFICYLKRAELWQLHTPSSFAPY